MSEAEKAKELSKWFDLDIPASMVCLSHSPMQHLLPHFNSGRILVLGMSDVRSVAKAYGFRHVLTTADIASLHPELVPHLIHESTGGEKVDSSHLSAQGLSPPLDLSTITLVVVMHDPNEWYRDMQILLDVMTSPTPPQLWFSNPDFLFSGRSSSPRLAQGAFRIAFSALYVRFTGKQLTYQLMGKPSTVTFEWAMESLGQRAQRMGFSSIDRFFMIGDNPEADIRHIAQHTTTHSPCSTFTPGNDSSKDELFTQRCVVLLCVLCCAGRRRQQGGLVDCSGEDRDSSYR